MILIFWGKESQNREFEKSGVLGDMTTSNPDRQAIGTWARYLGLGAQAEGDEMRTEIPCGPREKYSHDFDFHFEYKL